MLVFSTQSRGSFKDHMQIDYLRLMYVDGMERIVKGNLNPNDTKVHSSRCPNQLRAFALSSAYTGQDSSMFSARYTQYTNE